LPAAGHVFRQARRLIRKEWVKDGLGSDVRPMREELPGGGGNGGETAEVQRV
jgi:hypothetical protein